MMKKFLLIALCSVAFPACTREAVATPPANTYRIELFETVLGGAPATITGAVVSDEFFKTTGIRPLIGRFEFSKTVPVRPLIGRFFLPEEHKPDRGRVAVITHALWQKSFGGDPAVLGKTIQLNRESFTIVGILPSEFHTPQGVEIWIPAPL